MAFDSISTAEIAVDKPITSELMNKYKNRDDFLNGQIGTFQSVGVQNGSFEVDSDSDGQPDSWTPTFFTNGTGIITTSTSLEGANSYQFTHPGGAGNGGGKLVSDFIQITDSTFWQVLSAGN
jgi:hypothetical protein